MSTAYESSTANELRNRLGILLDKIRHAKTKQEVDKFQLEARGIIGQLRALADKN
ncbi:MAG TPA: hypothetical protein VIT43_09350 [Candidatus Dormibacteraeota bacterium]